MNYTYLDATYQSSESVGSPYNSAAEDGIIEVNKGNQIPLMPNHILKLRTAYRFTDAIRAGVQMIGVGKSYARGNENNEHQANVENDNGIKSTGDGKIPSYVIFNLTGSYKQTEQMSFFGTIGNLFDRRYYTAGMLGPTAFSSDGGYNNGGCNGVNWNPTTHDGACASSMMYAPGAPRYLWVGMRYDFDRPKNTN